MPRTWLVSGLSSINKFNKSVFIAIFHISTIHRFRIFVRLIKRKIHKPHSQFSFPFWVSACDSFWWKMYRLITACWRKYVSVNWDIIGLATGASNDLLLIRSFKTCQSTNIFINRLVFERTGVSKMLAILSRSVSVPDKIPLSLRTRNFARIHFDGHMPVKQFTICAWCLKTGTCHGIIAMRQELFLAISCYINQPNVLGKYFMFIWSLYWYTDIASLSLTNEQKIVGNANHQILVHLFMRDIPSYIDVLSLIDLSHKSHNCHPSLTMRHL